MKLRLPAALAAATLLCGCDGDRTGAAPGAGVATADSAGISIVTSITPEWGDRAEWQLRSEPELVIGDEHTLPSVLLVGVNGVRRLADGGFVVALNGDREVRWFDRRGREWGQAAGSGDGTAPFGSVELVGMLGDSVLVWDAQRELAAVLIPGKAAPQRHFVISSDTAVARYGFAVAGTFADGRLLLVGRSGTESRRRC
ncbi:MAG TPA: hypothetical protein PLL69_03310 [Gemmatimonadales bacterium]|nr:hypothetical protein [Gemmatimonadales bacterium]